MKKLALALLCVAATVASSPAANIAFVSFHPGDDTPSANAAAAPASFTQAPDVGYTQLLAANGHTVTRFLSKDLPTAADATAYNGFDLVIVSRSTASGHYQQPEESLFWNTTITKPVIHLGGYALRGSRLGFTTGDLIPDTTSPAQLEALVPNHPIFSGVSLDAGNIMVNSFAGIASHNGVTQRGISLNTSPLEAGGTLIARISAGTTIDNELNRGTGMVIGEWAAGAVINGGTETLGGNRLVFFTGSREMGITSEGAGIFDLSADGSTMFLNAVNYIVVPEPSTYALLGLGALALLMRWRKS
jgi:hypothetical protein